MQPQLSPYELPPGSTLDRYRIIRRLAVGGMAEIYLACATGLEGFEKRVVLKRILPQFACRPEFVGMFLDEARLAATLHHPNIAQVYDIGSDGETYYFTMEYVEGRDVRHIRKKAVARDEDVPLDHAVAIAMGIAGGLHHAHEKRSSDGTPLGIVHRDVSPANVIVTYDGTVKLIDFGIAKASRRQTQTRTGILKGKACSMSPEQCLGEALDRRSDIFSLGILLYELSTATRLFAGESEYETMRLIVDGKIEPPSRRRPEYPEKLEQIVLRALERDPADRYQTAQELFLDLDVFARDERMAVSPYSLAAYVEHLFPAAAESPEEGASPPLFLLGDDAELPDGLLADGPESESVDIEFGDDESMASSVRQLRALERAETVELSASGVSLPRAESDPELEPSGSSPRAQTITMIPIGERKRAASERKRAASERKRAGSERKITLQRGSSSSDDSGSDRRLSSEVGTSLVKVKSTRAPSTPIFQRRMSLVVLSASVAVALGILGFGLIGGRGGLSADRDAAATPMAVRASAPAETPAVVEPTPLPSAMLPSATVTVPVEEPAPAPPPAAKRTEHRATHRSHHEPKAVADHSADESSKRTEVRSKHRAAETRAAGKVAAGKKTETRPVASTSKAAPASHSAAKPVADKRAAESTAKPAHPATSAAPAPKPAPPAGDEPAEPAPKIVAPGNPEPHLSAKPHPKHLLSE